ncbi:MAG: LAGLIDADG family homing endonuclease, partial [Candidatus Diapherotrites archaeon]|nr:LAGLIDADG family homing endonuclease [Candidatus Diapherotrites archaeon]
YLWKKTNYYVILVGDKRFAEKYAKRVEKCIQTKTKAYPNRRQNVWFVRNNSYKLFSLFKKVREDVGFLEELLKKAGIDSCLFFVEGFFDAEGCVKIIKEPVRKTPKICLDITNTNFGFLEVVRNLLKENLGIAANYSSREGHLGKDGFLRKKVYHLRIYKKDFVRTFLEKIHTTKLKEEKIKYVENWLTNGK